jgi:DNA-directed RNA polymerase subunit RPC12/RpoP
LEAAFLFPLTTTTFVRMKQVKCPSCTVWYGVEVSGDKYSYKCSHCNAPYALKTEEQKIREEGMKEPVSKPPLTWKRFGEIHWALVIVNNIGFVIQTILFMIGTIIGILVAPL